MRFTFPVSVELDALPALEEGQNSGAVESWAQVLRTGKFKLSPKGPELNITESMLDQMVENANRYNEAPFDYDHLGTSGKGTAGESRAAGWAKKWERRADKLYALVSWTKKAAEHIRNGEYRYVSATFLTKFFDPESGKDVGARLLGAAITNYPFVQGMDPLALAAVSDLSLTDREQRVAQAWEQRFNPLGDFQSGYIAHFYDDFIVVKKDGKNWKLPYEMDNDLRVSFPSEPVEVILTPQELSTMPNITDEQFNQLSTQLTTLQGQVTELSAGRVKDQETIAKLEIDLAAAKQLGLNSEANTVVDGLITAGKLLPKQKEWALGYYKTNKEGFLAFSATLEPLLRFDREDGTGEAVGLASTGVPRKKKDGRLENTDKRVVEFSNKVTEYRKENKVDAAAAMAAVAEAHPDLFTAYRESFADYGGDEAVQ